MWKDNYIRRWRGFGCIKFFYQLVILHQHWMLFHKWCQKILLKLPGYWGCFRFWRPLEFSGQKANFGYVDQRGVGGCEVDLTWNQWYDYSKKKSMPHTLFPYIFFKEFHSKVTFSLQSGNTTFLLKKILHLIVVRSIEQIIVTLFYLFWGILNKLSWRFSNKYGNPKNTNYRDVLLKITFSGGGGQNFASL